MTDETLAAKPRSKRLYVYWGVALALLLVLGLVCWKVVVPVLQARAAVARCNANPHLTSEEIKKLGGPEHAAYCLSLYARMPDWIAGDKREAAFMLGFCGKPAVPALVGLLGDKNKYVRGAAALSLGEIGPEARGAVPALVRLLGDKDEDVCRAAMGALVGIGPDAREAIPALIGLLGDERAYVRLPAAWALGKIGPEAREAVPALQKLLQDENRDVRHAASQALKKIKAAQEKKQ